MRSDENRRLTQAGPAQSRSNEQTPRSELPATLQRVIPSGRALHFSPAKRHDFSPPFTNLAKPFEKIIEATGLTVLPKLIQNLRASCETEWLDRGTPAHVVAKWIGHSVKVQNDNYAQVDDHHFDQFNTGSKHRQNASAAAVFGTDDSKLKVAHQVAQKTPGKAKTGQRRKEKNPAKLNVLRGSAEDFASLRNSQVPEAGVEPAHGITHTGF